MAKRQNTGRKKTGGSKRRASDNTAPTSKGRGRKPNPRAANKSSKKKTRKRTLPPGDPAKKKGYPKRRPDDQHQDQPDHAAPSAEEVARAIEKPKKLKNLNKRQGDGTHPGPFRKPQLRIQTTTLWSYPSQHYGNKIQGDRNYVGATPSWIVWQLIQRYTKPGDTVIDPMAGSGTTIDVANDTNRAPLGFDLAPSRDDIQQADARNLPVKDNTAQLLFIDPPYSTHIEYSEHPDCIGKLDALDKRSRTETNAVDARRNDYFNAMNEVFHEALRVLKPGGTIAVYVSDTFRKGEGFAPIGVELFNILKSRFTPLDIIAVERGNEKLNRGNFHKAAEEQNFFLRGFNYLLIAQKPRYAPKPRTTTKPRTTSSKPAPRGQKPIRNTTPSNRNNDTRVGGRRAHQQSEQDRPFTTKPRTNTTKPTRKKGPLGPKKNTRRGGNTKPGSL